MPELLITRAGPLTTVQDHGRHGTAHLGVPRAGALDQPAYLAANRLVGNAPGAAVLETTLGGAAVTATGSPLLVAVTGAPARITVNGQPAAWGAPVFLPAGATLNVGPADSGVRSYLAVAGGLVPPPVLGSRSADLLAHLGPPPLRDGDRLPVGTTHGPPAAELVPLPAMPTELVLRLLPGPRADWLLPGSLVALARARYRVATASNRIALRSEGPALIRARRGELESEGMVLGAVQVPPDGQPVVFLADHPTTGGYPVIGVVPEADLPAAAQARPGTPVRFIPITG